MQNLTLKQIIENPSIIYKHHFDEEFYPNLEIDKVLIDTSYINSKLNKRLFCVNIFVLIKDDDYNIITKVDIFYFDNEKGFKEILNLYNIKEKEIEIYNSERGFKENWTELFIKN